MPSAVLSANAVAVAAGVSKNWVYRAIDIGVLSEPCFAADAVVLRVYRVLSQFAWPDKPKQRSVKQKPDTWLLAALNAVRDAASDEKTTPETTLYVLGTAVHIANTRIERALLEASGPEGTEPSALDAQVAIRLPIGRWIDELPSVLAKTPRHAPRRGVPPRQPAAS
ncbi:MULTISPECIES: hypothetical protein [unclassified Streptomyces]|uniref:hypothetical protein n=1 Tax=unclassified Streptomyces TaxID=2593676 RepID=UPI00227059EA|nr:MULTISPECIES: hypothetical protein [unclassified Streptomyces]MCY0920791.1 hypothetical protein [Streptomyces sp. H27-G5]MCY0961250.1 hypothetical protein [Streptomyces sp. H27-H5]